jgi:hypothetical protein
MTKEFNRYVKSTAEKLGRTEASVRSKLHNIGVKASDTPRERDAKILLFVVKRRDKGFRR